jgi:hypothetical protein
MPTTLMCMLSPLSSLEYFLTVSYSRDPFPIDPEAPEETHQLTVRALVVGAVLGCVGECISMATDLSSC